VGVPGGRVEWWGAGAEGRRGMKYRIIALTPRNMSVPNPLLFTTAYVTLLFTMPSPPPKMTAMEVLGAVFLLLLSVVYLPVYIVAHLLIQFMYLPRTLHRHIFHPTNILQRKYFAKDAYAIVTGATDGAGKGFVEQLAARGVSFLSVTPCGYCFSDPILSRNG